MARIAGVDLPREKRVEAALTSIYGIGPTTARRVIAAAGVSLDTRVKDLTDSEIAKLRATIENNYRTEGALRGDVAFNIRRLMDIGCYRGLRHRRGLPMHGQRTRTNARTRKGPRRTIGAKRSK